MDDRRKRSRSGQTWDSLVWGALLGGAAGAVLGHAVDGAGALVGAVIGAVIYAPLEAVMRARLGPADAPPIWQRILGSALAMSLFGALLGTAFSWVGGAILSGALLGLVGLRPLKVLIGVAVGAVVGVALSGAGAALVAAAVTVVYRVIAAFAYRNRPLVRVMAQEVPAAELRYVVPFEARSKYVGAGYVQQLAELRGGTFRRNPPDVGILASLDALDGPDFDAGRVHPLIREFYEHTSRFKLSIVPDWRAWMKPSYEIFKRLVAQPLGQAAIPSNLEEAQRGMVTTINTIALARDREIEIR